jgi:hypothetical protein
MLKVRWGRVDWSSPILVKTDSAPCAGRDPLAGGFP